MTSLFHSFSVSTPLLGLLAQAEAPELSTGSVIGGAIATIVWLALVILILAGMWKMFEKAGKPGWAAIVPIYNVIVLLQIAGKPLWWIILLFIPIVNILVGLFVSIALAKSFGRGAGFGIGILVLGFIFIPMLGFGQDKYVGPQGQLS
ncbi:MAG TPA: DUF5684 domain-containing protein [Chthoniobacterales bacterium]|jgi:hypothetical protein